MRRRRFFALLGCLALLTPARADDPLAAGFRNPPRSARPHTWWHWMNGNVSEAGITADLEAMAKAGIGGAQIFNVHQGIPAGKMPFFSPAWRKAVVHAAREARRLGLELCLHNCAGWSSSGGPWITPESAMQKLTWSETPVSGPGRFDAALALPPTVQGFYRDIAVLAVKKPAAETAQDRLRIDGIGAKAAFERGGTLRPLDTPTPAGRATPRDGGVVALRIAADGTLRWDVPEGEWTLVRLGHTLTGAVNAPAPEIGRGLEVDKLRRAAMDVHWKGAIEPILQDLGPALAGKVLNNALIDSYEVGSQNWTPGFADEFRRRRGYDPLPWLPVVTGRVIESVEQSERFLWDFRRTVCDLFAENYFGYFGQLCKKNGLLFSVEPYGNGSFDNLQVGTLADIPMGEFWIGGAAAETTKLAASTAHVRGRKIVGAESFTADWNTGRWLVEPYGIKALGDKIFTLGVNRYIFHRYAHQPWTRVAPGMTMGPWGTHFERTTTWWDQSGEWLKYVARCQFLLQSGRFVADVLAFCGDDGPNDMPNLRPALPDGYDYDGCDATALKTLTVQNGALVLPSGMRYQILVLPDSRWMLPATLRKIHALVRAGATIVGPRPLKSPSLADFGAGDAEIERLAADLWGDLDGKTKTVRAFGKGRILWGVPLAKAVGAEPDVAVDDSGRGAKIAWIHRQIGNDEVYFVSNQRYRPEQVTLRFRRGILRRPELWHPETGKSEPAVAWKSERATNRVGTLTLPLGLGPAESVFVVFRQPVTTPPDGVRLEFASGAAAPPRAPRLEIRKALYEAIDGFGAADVTAKVAELAKRGEFEIPATNATFGDPTPLHRKRLRVDFTLNGKPQTKSVDENQTLELLFSGSDSDFPDYEIVDGELRPWRAGTLSIGRPGIGRSIRRKVAVPAPITQPLSGPWKLSFPPHLGAPPSMTLPKLISWTEHENPGVRYFSGTATYQTIFVPGNAPTMRPERPPALYLDLGRVKHFAQITLNGKTLPTLWKAPWRVDVTHLVQPGKNTLTVRITNLWPNRLIGDERLPAEAEYNPDGSITALPAWLVEGTPRPKTGRIAFSTWKFYDKDSPLRESGLLGPVRLWTVPRIPLK